jgi:hypothetical protein
MFTSRGGNCIAWFFNLAYWVFKDALNTTPHSNSADERHGDEYNEVNVLVKISDHIRRTLQASEANEILIVICFLT